MLDYVKSKVIDNHYNEYVPSPINSDIPQTRCIADHFKNADGLGYELTMIGPNDAQAISNYLNFCSKFHIDDFKNQKNTDMTLEAFEKRVQSVISANRKKFEDGELSLILLYLKGEVVGGSFYSIEEEGEVKKEGNTIRIQAFSFNREDKEENTKLYSKTLIDHLLDRNAFPHATQVVVMVRNSSSEQHLLKSHGFTENYDYPLPAGYNKDHFTIYGRKIDLIEEAPKATEKTKSFAAKVFDSLKKIAQSVINSFNNRTFYIILSASAVSLYLLSFPLLQTVAISVGLAYAAALGVKFVQSKYASTASI
jgi:hypothetical protein